MFDVGSRDSIQATLPITDLVDGRSKKLELIACPRDRPFNGELQDRIPLANDLIHRGDRRPSHREEPERRTRFNRWELIPVADENEARIRTPCRLDHAERVLISEHRRLVDDPK